MTCSNHVTSASRRTLTWTAAIGSRDDLNDLLEFIWFEGKKKSTNEMRRTTKNKLTSCYIEKDFSILEMWKRPTNFSRCRVNLIQYRKKNLVMKRYFSITTREAFLVLRLRALSKGLFFPIHKTNHRTNQTASIASLMRALVITTKSYLNKWNKPSVKSIRLFAKEESFTA